MDFLDASRMQEDSASGVVQIFSREVSILNDNCFSPLELSVPARDGIGERDRPESLKLKFDVGDIDIARA